MLCVLLRIQCKCYINSWWRHMANHFPLNFLKFLYILIHSCWIHGYKKTLYFRIPWDSFTTLSSPSYLSLENISFCFFLKHILLFLIEYKIVCKDWEVYNWNLKQPALFFCWVISMKEWVSLIIGWAWSGLCFLKILSLVFLFLQNFSFPSRLCCLLFVLDLWCREHFKTLL